MPRPANYGVMSYQGLARDEPDLEHARWLYNRACQFDYAPACFNLARIALNGEGGAVDVAVARTGIETSCDAWRASLARLLRTHEPRTAVRPPYSWPSAFG